MNASDLLILSSPTDNSTYNLTPASTGSSIASTRTFRTAAAIVYFLIALSGILGYSLYCYVVLKHRKTLANPFYSMTVSLAIPDCLSNLLTVIYVVPSMLMTERGTGRELLPDPSFARHMFGFLSDYSWFLICAHMVLIASNRSISMRFSTSYVRLFARRRLIAALIGCYLVSLVIPTVTYVCSCRFEFVQLSWMVDCEQESDDGNSTSMCSDVIMLLDSIATNAQIAFVLLCNAFILIFVIRKRRKVKHTSSYYSKQALQNFKKERCLVLQFTSIALILIFGQITFWILPILVERGWVSECASGFGSNVLSLLTSSLNPFFYFTFSSEIRRCLRMRKDNSKKAANKATSLQVKTVTVVKKQQDTAGCVVSAEDRF